MASFALAIRQPANGEQVGAGEQTNAILETKPEPGIELVLDIEQTRVNDP